MHLCAGVAFFGSGSCVMSLTMGYLVVTESARGQFRVSSSSVQSRGFVVGDHRLSVLLVLPAALGRAGEGMGLP